VSRKINLHSTNVNASLRAGRKNARRSRQWEVKISLRQKRRAYFESSIFASDGRTFLAVYSQRVSCLTPYAEMVCEFRALAYALEWLRHTAMRSKACITLSATTLAIIRGEIPCPQELNKLRARLLGQHFPLSGMVWIGNPAPVSTHGVQERRAA
jgi:hypothetical protein